jgi:predicted phage terminase large subunit-like protein
MEAGGLVTAAGVGGSIMGRGAHGLLIDDYIKNIEDALSERIRDKIYEWYLSTASTRLAPNAWVVIIATRWHRKDLIGRLLEDAKTGGEQWCRLRLPAIAEENDPLGRKPGEALWPERFPIEWLENVKGRYKASGYDWMWEALYQQNPPDVLDAEFKPEYFPDSMWFTDWPAELVHRVQTCDPSLGKTDKSDYQAHVMLGLDYGGTLWVEADLRRRDRVQIAADLLDFASIFHPEIIGIETNMWQVMLADEVWQQSKNLGMAENIWEINNWENKIVRIRSTLTSYLARGALRFRDTPGTRLLVEQLKGFPTCKHDDGPDALEMAVRIVREVFRRDINGQSLDEGDDIIAEQGLLY